MSHYHWFVSVQLGRVKFTVKMADYLSEFAEVPASKVRRERMKAMIVRISTPISSGICDLKGPVVRIMKNKASA